MPSGFDLRPFLSPGPPPAAVEPSPDRPPQDEQHQADQDPGPGADEQRQTGQGLRTRRCRHDPARAVQPDGHVVAGRRGRGDLGNPGGLLTIGPGPAHRHRDPDRRRLARADRQLGVLLDDRLDRGERTLLLGGPRRRVRPADGADRRHDRQSHQPEGEQDQDDRRFGTIDTARQRIPPYLDPDRSAPPGRLGLHSHTHLRINRPGDNVIQAIPLRYPNRDVALCAEPPAVTDATALGLPIGTAPVPTPPVSPDPPSRDTRT